MATKIAPVSAAELKKMAKARQRVGYFKLSADVSNFRLLAPGEKTRQNVYKIDDKWTSSLDGSFVIENTDLREAALAAGRITEKDVEAYATFGDPFTMLAERYQQLDIEVPRNLWPSTKYLWAVIDRANPNEGVLKFESSMTFAKTINALTDPETGDYPDLFDADNGFDVKVVGNGKSGTGRRYEAPVLARKASPVGQDFTVPEFKAQMVKQVKPFVERVNDLFKAFGDKCAEVGFTPQSFGLTKKQVDV